MRLIVLSLMLAPPLFAQKTTICPEKCTVVSSTAVATYTYGLKTITAPKYPLAVDCAAACPLSVARQAKSFTVKWTAATGKSGSVKVPAASTTVSYQVSCEATMPPNADGSLPDSATMTNPICTAVKQ